MSLEDLVGTRIPPRVVTVERGPVVDFSSAVKDERSEYRSLAAARSAGFDRIPTPPTFAFVAPNKGSFVDDQPEVPSDAVALVELIAALRDGREGMILHGAEDFTYHGPVCVGDTFDVTGYVESAQTKPGTPEQPGMSVLVVRTDFQRAGTDQVAVTTRSTFLFRPARSN
ncbi:MAG TPA: MaoC family dehydratase N-terminal domain-containing protein [Mycobacteriales bacterium]|nr:MaoC family dehydratase N-terminal domain-containing protein [Mycobacteriales bacterium]